MDKASSQLYCLAPWTSLYVQHDGDVFPCCHWTRFGPLGSLKSQTYKEIWNSDRTKKLRLEMLKGKSPTECEDCRFFDRIGAQSLRTDYMRDQKQFLDRTTQTKPDGEYKLPDIVSLSIAVGTKCQLKCRTCGPSDSSSWEAHLQKDGAPVLSRHLQHLDQIQEIVQNSVSLNRVLFVGGEPIIHENHYQILNLLLKSSHVAKPRLYYNTNLFQISWKKYNIVDYWNQFPDVTAFISIDGSQDRFDFIRTGHRWPLLIENLKKLRSQAPHVKIKAYVTISLYNFLYMPETIKDLMHEAQFSAPDIHFNIVRIPLKMNIRNAPDKIKNQAKAKYLKFMKQLLSEFDHIEVAKLITGLQSIISFFEEQKPEAAQYQEFLEFNNNEVVPSKTPDFSSTFPELLTGPR